MQPATAQQPVLAAVTTEPAALTPAQVYEASVPATHPVAPPASFGRAVLLSVLIALAGIAGWAILAEAVHARTALISFAVAAGVAAIMGRLAPFDRRAPAAILGLTIASALLGLLASQYVLLANGQHMSVTTAIDNVPLSKIPKLLTIGTTPITWIIIAVSAYTGFGYAQRHAAARRAAAARMGTP
jgi:hypothetical protein